MKQATTILAAIAWLAFAAGSQAQFVTASYTSGFSTLWASAETTNVFSYSDSINVQKVRNVKIQVKLGCSEAGAAGTNVNFLFVGSFDNLNWDTNTTTRFKVCVPHAGTDVPYIYSTNFDVGGLGWLRLATVHTPIGTGYDGNVTNNAIKYSYKIGAY
jgi:hypothetical protein